MLAAATAGTPVPPAVLASLVGFESGWKPGARSQSSSASGLGQVLDSTARDPGYDVPPLSPDATPQEKLAFSAKYLAARGKAAGLTEADWKDPEKLRIALGAYHGAQTDANGVNGDDYGRRILGMSGANSAAAGLGTGGYGSSMVAGTLGTIDAEQARKQSLQAPVLADMQSNYKRDQLRFDKAAENFKPIEPPKEAPAVPQTDPLHAFGSIAGVFATLAAGFTHTPAIAAMNGLAGAITAAKQSDWDTYAAKYKQWKDNTELTIQNHKLQAADMADALDVMKTDIATGSAMAKAVAAQSDDKIATELLRLGKYEELSKVQDERARTAVLLEQHSLDVQQVHEKAIANQPVIDATKEYLTADGASKAAQAKLQQATASNDPAAIASAQAEVAKAQQDLTGARQKVSDAHSMVSGTRAAQPGTAQYITQQVYDQIMREHPETPPGDAWTQAIDRTRTAGKPVSENVQKTKDETAIATADFKSQNGRDPGPEDAAEMAHLRVTARQNGTFKPDEAKSVGKMIADYQIAPLVGNALRTPFGQAVMAEVKSENPDYQATEFGARSKAARDFATGPQGKSVNSFNVGISHLNLLTQLSDALGNGDVQSINRLSNAFSAEIGGTAPTNFEAAKQIVGQEIVKAVVGTGAGGVAERAEAGERLLRASSPEQLRGVVDTYKRLMAGQLGGLKQQYETTTGRHDFEERLSPETRKELESLPGSDPKNPRGAPGGPDGGTPPVPSSLAGKKLQWSPSRKMFRDESGVVYDANGNRAY